jgi:hypothetical protein
MDNIDKYLNEKRYNNGKYQSIQKSCRTDLILAKKTIDDIIRKFNGLKEEDLVELDWDTLADNIDDLIDKLEYTQDF